MKEDFTREELQKMPLEQLSRLLTDRERLFVEEYLRDYNGTQAAVRAKYARKNASATAWRLLRKDTVAVYRDRKVKETFEAMGITPAFVQLGCLEIYKRCMAKEPVMAWDIKEHAWLPSGEWQFDARGALRALNQMADLLGMKKGDDDDDAPGGYESQLAGGSGEERTF